MNATRNLLGDIAFSAQAFHELAPRLFLHHGSLDLLLHEKQLRALFHYFLLQFPLVCAFLLLFLFLYVDLSAVFVLEFPLKKLVGLSHVK